MKFLGQISQLCPWHCLNLTVCTQLLWLFNHESHRYLSLYRSNTRGADGPYVWSAPHHRMRGSRCLATERWRTFCSISHLCPIFIGISYHFKPQRQVMTYRDPQKWSIFHMESWLSCSDIMNACGSRIAMAASQTLWEMGKRTSHISWLTIKSQMSSMLLWTWFCSLSWEWWLQRTALICHSTLALVFSFYF